MNEWYKLEITETLKTLNTSLDGLSKKEVTNRLIRYGKNVLPKQKKDNIFTILLREISNPITIILFITVLFSFIIKEYTDSIVILFIILIDIIMGIISEMKAIRNADALSKMIKETVRVVRSGKELVISAENLVPGDIVLLESGDKVSADMRIIKYYNLEIDESVLTGESIAIYKNNNTLKNDTLLADQKNMAFAGTSVITGRALAVVTETGLNTEIGKIADEVISAKEEKSPLTIRVEKFSNQISAMIVVIGIIIATILYLKGYDFNNIFILVISLSISAMPEGLPLALTMALTIGANRMAKKNVIAKRLNSVEALGSCSVIITDKTGTLTVNEQTAKKIILPDNTYFNIGGTGYNNIGTISGVEDNKKELEYIATLGVINNESFLEERENSWDYFGDSIDIAFLALGEKVGVNTKNYEIISKIPYESVNQYSAVIYKKGIETRCTVKGSIEKITDFCTTMGSNHKKINIEALSIQAENLAKEGYRVIALADGLITGSKYTEKNIKALNFIGLVAFVDPVRDDVTESVRVAKKAGIEVIMVTGDHPLTAYNIAKCTGICKNYNEVTDGVELKKYLALGEIAFDNFVATKKVFSRVSPMEKLEIVNSIKRQNHFVAVTGDGVNDAPAIKRANIGISMGSGTDVSKDCAMMIIKDDNFTSIVEGIKEGRTAYSNIRKIIYMLISCGLAEILFFMLSIIYNMEIPLLAIQLLWLNIVTDGLQDLALSFEPPEKDLMKQKPRSKKESLFNKSLFEEITISGIFIGLIVFITWLILIKKMNMDITLSRAYIMTLMVFIQNIHVLNCRSEEESTFKVPFKNPLLLVSITSSILLQILIVRIPLLSNFFKISTLQVKEIISLFILSLSILITMELYKLIKKLIKKISRKI